MKRGNGESMKETKKMGTQKKTDALDNLDVLERAAKKHSLSNGYGKGAESREVPKPALRRMVDVVIAEVEHRAFAYNLAWTDMVENEKALAKSQQWADDAKHELNRVKKELDALIAAIGR